MDSLSSARQTGCQRPCRIRLRPGTGGPHFMAVVVIFACVLSPTTGAARTWHVPTEAPTIQAGIDSARAGDDVLVAPGRYLEHDIAMKAGVTVHSEQGPSATTVDATSAGSGFVCTNLDQTAVIEGFSILNGYTRDYGGGVRCDNSRLVMRDCSVTACTSDYSGGGISADQSDVVIEGCTVNSCLADYVGGGILALSTTVAIVDCQVLNNDARGSGGGIFAHGPEVTIARCVVSGNIAWWGEGGGIGCSSAVLTIQECLITHNRAWEIGKGAGLSEGSCAGSILACTIAHNDATYGGEAVLLLQSNVEVDRTVIAFNYNPALTCESAQVTVHCTDVYGNTGGNEICGDDLGGNFSADPLFCNYREYTLDANSPCLPGNHPQGVDCGLIGARGQGCGTPPPTGACCFMDGSCVVAGQQDCEDEHGTYMGDGTTCDPNPCHPTPVRITTWGRIKAGFR